MFLVNNREESFKIGYGFIIYFSFCYMYRLITRIQHFEIRNIGKWSEISAVIIPECVSLYRKWFVLIWSIFIALSWYSCWYIYDGNKVFWKYEIQIIFNFNVRLVIKWIKICVAYYIYCFIRIFHFIKEISNICFMLFKITGWLSILCTNDNIFVFFYLLSLWQVIQFHCCLFVNQTLV